MFTLKLIYNICINFTRGVFSDEWTNEAYIHSVAHLDNSVFRVDLFVSPPPPTDSGLLFVSLELNYLEVSGPYYGIGVLSRRSFKNFTHTLSFIFFNHVLCFKYVCFLKPQNHLTCAYWYDRIFVFRARASKRIPVPRICFNNIFF